MAMRTYQVVEKFVKHQRRGQTWQESFRCFIRFKGCNLQCSYCDTSWANEPGCEWKVDKRRDSFWIRETGVKKAWHLQAGNHFCGKGWRADRGGQSWRIHPSGWEIETNGSVDLKPYHILKNRPVLYHGLQNTDSGHGKRCFFPIPGASGQWDTLRNSWSAAAGIWKKPLEILEKYRLIGKSGSLFQSLFSAGSSRWRSWISLWKKLNDVKLQIQLHKVIWDPQKRGSMTEKILQYKQKYRRKRRNDMKLGTLQAAVWDSTTCLGLCREQIWKRECNCINSSLRTEAHKEIEAARKAAEYYEVEHLYLDLEPIFRYVTVRFWSIQTEKSLTKAMQSSWRKPMDHRCQPMCRFGTDYFFPQQQALRCQKTAVWSITERMRMMLPEMRIRTVAVHFHNYDQWGNLSGKRRSAGRLRAPLSVIQSQRS